MKRLLLIAHCSLLVASLSGQIRQRVINLYPHTPLETPCEVGQLGFDTTDALSQCMLVGGVPTWVQLANNSGDQRFLGFMAIGGTTVNNSTATGFVVTKIDTTFTDPDNEVRGFSAVLRNVRTVPDAPSPYCTTLGCDFFAVMGSVVVEAANTQHIIGNQKAVTAEIYTVMPSSGTYLVDRAHGFQTNVNAGANTTITTWDGLVINQPAGSGAITNGTGIRIENLDSAGSVIDSTNAAAIKIEGINNFGRILFNGASITDYWTGSLHHLLLTAGANILLGTGTAVKDSAGTYYGMDALGFALSGTTVLGTISGTAQSLSLTGFINSTGAVNTWTGYRVAGAATAGHCLVGADVGGGQIYYVDGACGGVTGSGTAGTIPKWSSGTALGNSILADNGAGAIVLTGTDHFDSAGGYYVGGTQIVTGARSISNVVDITAAGNLASGSGNHNVSAGAGASGGFFFESTQAAKWSGSGAAITFLGTVTTPGISNAGYGIDTATLTASSYITATSYISTSSYLYATSYVDTATGYKVASATPTAGHYLRSNGSYFVDGTIGSGDLPDLSSTYLPAAKHKFGQGQLSGGSLVVSTGCSAVAHMYVTLISGGAPAEYLGTATPSGGSVTVTSNNGSSISFFDWYAVCT